MSSNLIIGFILEGQLYAYIQKYEIVSADTTLAGDDKSSKLNSIKENIKDLAQTLGIKYEPEKTEE